MDLKTSSRKFIKKTFVLQQDQTDCGIASLLSIVHFYGGENLLERLRELSGTLITGTTMLGLYQCAELIGFDVKGVRINIDFLEAQTQPCILHVVIDGKMEHYVTYYGIKSLFN
jgi:ATP-binding cassette, subfamily C, bacteriocin exporter